MRRGLVVALSLWASGALIGADAQDEAAQPAAPRESADPFASLTPLPDAALAEARGGLDIAGYQVEFGVIVNAQGQLVSSLVTDLEALRDALIAAGQDPSIYVNAQEVLGSDGLTTVVVNRADGVQLEQFVRIDVVVTDLGGPALLRSGRDTLSLIGLPDTLPAF